MISNAFAQKAIRHIIGYEENHISNILLVMCKKSFILNCGRFLKVI